MPAKRPKVWTSPRVTSINKATRCKRHSNNISGVPAEVLCFGIWKLKMLTVQSTACIIKDTVPSLTYLKIKQRICCPIFFCLLAGRELVWQIRDFPGIKASGCPSHCSLILMNILNDGDCKKACVNTTPLPCQLLRVLWGRHPPLPAARTKYGGVRQ